jgi:hypothetical protein
VNTIAKLLTAVTSSYGLGGGLGNHHYSIAMFGVLILVNQWISELKEEV